MDDHARQAENVGGYLLGALSELERQAFERHLAACARCRDELELLRPAADALPRSVPQVAPPASLKASLMEAVGREASERLGGRVHRRRALRQWLAPLAPSRMRPVAAWVSAAFLLAAGVALGAGAASLLGGDDPRTVTASADRERVPLASGTLVIPEGDAGATLRVHGLPSLVGGRVYQAWVRRDGEVVPQGTFEVAPDGSGAVAITEDLDEAGAVMVTREPRGGARAPSERPILIARI
jgi:hypothetical protein